jgi:GDP-L-fucose synthase
MLSKSSKIFIAGHKGLVGSALVRRLDFFGYNKIIVRNRKQLDLRMQEKVENFLKKIK